MESQPWFVFLEQQQQQNIKCILVFIFCSVVCFLVLLVQEKYFINISSWIYAESKSLLLQPALNA